MENASSIVVFWEAISFTIAVFVVVISILKVVRIYRKGRIDIFDLARYINMILHFSMALVVFVSDASLQENNIPYSLLYWYMFDVNIYCFVLLNFTLWVILLSHIHLYSKLRQGMPYTTILKRLKIIEKIAVSLLILVHLVLFMTIVSICIFDATNGCECLYCQRERPPVLSFICEISNKLQSFLYYSKCAFYSTFFFLTFVLSIVYLYSLRKHLNFYYKQVKNMLVFLSLLSLIYFGLEASQDIVELKIKMSLSERLRPKNDDTLTPNERFWHFCVNSVLQLVFLAYIILSMKLFSFHRYLNNIFRGFGVEADFKEASIFIYRYHRRVARDHLQNRRDAEESTCEDVKNEINRMENMETHLLIGSGSTASEHSENYMSEYQKILKFERENSRVNTNPNNSTRIGNP
ncbi:unnamed protein product [Moneuplotes crassus]|uniref:Uncharacterized protein n=1 Tax=Euplotes crassus TaxID=5936 RepID=A0AAD1XGD7_EUPCR|nr:unnamed protein product [Moneuplotes crassus]